MAKTRVMMAYEVYSEYKGDGGEVVKVDHGWIRATTERRAIKKAMKSSGKERMGEEWYAVQLGCMGC